MQFPGVFLHGSIRVGSNGMGCLILALYAYFGIMDYYNNHVMDNDARNRTVVLIIFIEVENQITGI